MKAVAFLAWLTLAVASVATLDRVAHTSSRMSFNIKEQMKSLVDAASHHTTRTSKRILGKRSERDYKEDDEDSKRGSGRKERDDEKRGKNKNDDDEDDDRTGESKKEKGDEDRGKEGRGGRNDDEDRRSKGRKDDDDNDKDENRGKGRKKGEDKDKDGRDGEDREKTGRSGKKGKDEDDDGKGKRGKGGKKGKRKKKGKKSKSRRNDRTPVPTPEPMAPAPETEEPTSLAPVTPTPSSQSSTEAPSPTSSPTLDGPVQPNPGTAPPTNLDSGTSLPGTPVPTSLGSETQAPTVSSPATPAPTNTDIMTQPPVAPSPATPAPTDTDIMTQPPVMLDPTTPVPSISVTVTKPPVATVPDTPAPKTPEPTPVKPDTPDPTLTPDTPAPFAQAPDTPAPTAPVATTPQTPSPTTGITVTKPPSEPPSIGTGDAADTDGTFAIACFDAEDQETMEVPVNFAYEAAIDSDDKENMRFFLDNVEATLLIAMNSSMCAKRRRAQSVSLFDESGHQVDGIRHLEAGIVSLSSLPLDVPVGVCGTGCTIIDGGMVVTALAGADRKAIQCDIITAVKDIFSHKMAQVLLSTEVLDCPVQQSEQAIGGDQGRDDDNRKNADTLGGNSGSNEEMRIGLGAAVGVAVAGAGVVVVMLLFVKRNRPEESDHYQTCNESKADEESYMIDFSPTSTVPLSPVYSEGWESEDTKSPVTFEPAQLAEDGTLHEDTVVSATPNNNSESPIQAEMSPEGAHELNGVFSPESFALLNEVPSSEPKIDAICNLEILNDDTSVSSGVLESPLQPRNISNEALSPTVETLNQENSLSSPSSNKVPSLLKDAFNDSPPNNNVDVSMVTFA